MDNDDLDKKETALVAWLNISFLHFKKNSIYNLNCLNSPEVVFSILQEM